MRKKTRESSGEVWDFYVYSPSGQKFRSTREVTKYLESNPDVKCDPEVTHCKRPKDLSQFSTEKDTSEKGHKRSYLELNLQNEDTENTVPGKALNGGQTGNQKPKKKMKVITINVQ